ncbi:MAG: UrcA family protein [Rhizomicrobium sp.]
MSLRLAGALALTLLATPALAGGSAKPALKVDVSYADLDIASAAGALALEQRIHAAAVAVCGPVDSHLDTRGSAIVEAMQANAACIARAAAKARTRVAALQNRSDATQIAAAGH